MVSLSDELKNNIIAAIEKDYLDLDKSFVDAIVKSIRHKKDLYGYFSLQKNVLILTSSEQAPLGLTVATTKLGGSVKFGPTLILPLFRGLGLYHAIIDLREKYYRDQGARKLYCTVPETKPEVWRTLMKHGYIIEAKLRSQYRPGVTEYVLAKLLQNTGLPSTRSHTFSLLAKEESAEDYYISQKLSDSTCRKLVTFFLEQGRAFYPISESFVHSICKAHRRYKGLSTKTYSRKGKRVFLALTRDAHENILAALVSTPKRGGSVKLSPFLAKEGVSKSILLKLYKTAESFFTSEGARKLYLHLPVEQTTLVSTILALGYQKEGELREPYMPGVNMVVLGKLLKDHSPTHDCLPSTA